MMMMMNKKLMIGVAAGFAAAACVAAAKKSQSEPSPDMWTKMREKMEEMPADFPPRVMFDNLEATKANTEEILSLLQREGSERANADAMATI
jgi:ABC-type glycerol-3-phosphate transport system substrate-binding protein